MLSGYHAIAAQHNPIDADIDNIGDTQATKASTVLPDKPSFEIPELMHNINLMVDTCEENLISADRYKITCDNFTVVTNVHKIFTIC